MNKVLKISFIVSILLFFIFITNVSALDLNILNSIESTSTTNNTETVQNTNNTTIAENNTQQTIQTPNEPTSTLSDTFSNLPEAELGLPNILNIKVK